MASSITEAIAGTADLLRPIAGSLTMSRQLRIPVFIATICSLMMFIPTFLVAENTGQVSSDPPGRIVHSAVPELQPLINDNPGCDRADRQIPHESSLRRSKAGIFAICFVSFFLIYASGDSVNFLIPWVSFRFKPSMARVYHVTPVWPNDANGYLGWTSIFAQSDRVNISIPWPNSRRESCSISNRETYCCREKPYLVKVERKPALYWIIPNGFCAQYLGAGCRLHNHRPRVWDEHHSSTIPRC
jgi:hypothetical protein